MTYSQRYAVYPTVKFICEGTIRRIWFIGRVSSTSATTATVPTFQIYGRPGSRSDSDTSTACENYEFVNSIIAEESEVSVDGSEYSVFKIDIESNSSFREGYVLGSMTARQTIDIANRNADICSAYLSSFKYNDTVQLGSESFTSFPINYSVENSSPLVAIESGK